MKISSAALESADQASEISKEVWDLSQNIQINDKGSYEKVVSVLAEVRSRKTVVEAKRKSFVDPLNQVIRELNSLFKPSLAFLSRAELLLKKGITDFRLSCREKEQKALSAASSAAIAKNLKAFNESMGEVSSLQVPTVKGVSFRASWKYEVEDISEVPLAFLQIDDVKVRKLISEKKENALVPGLRIFSEESTVVRKALG